MRNAFVNRLTAIAEHDPGVVLVTGDLGFGVLQDFEQRFPRQYLNVGVAEQNMTAVAAGLAREGRRVFTYSIANFPTLRCLEQLRNDVCYHNANVTVVSIGGGFSYGSLGPSHHATEDLAILRSLANLTVVAPGDNWEVEEATTALASRDGPSYLRLDKSSAGYTQTELDIFRLGRARTVREGDDLAFICTGGILGEVLSAADALRAEGMNPRVLSMHTLSEPDVDAIAGAARATGGIVTVEEHRATGGLAGLVSEVCLTHGFPPQRFLSLSAGYEFVSEVGSQGYLRHICGLDAEAIALAARRLLKPRSSAALA